MFGGIGSVATSAVPTREKKVFTSGMLLERALELELHLERLREARAGNAQRLHGDIALVEARNELRAHARWRASRRAATSTTAPARTRHAQAQRRLEHRRIEPLARRAR